MRRTTLILLIAVLCIGELPSAHATGAAVGIAFENMRLQRERERQREKQRREADEKCRIPNDLKAWSGPR